MAAAAQANIAELSISKNVELKVAEPLDGVAAKYVSDHTSALAALRQIAAGLASRYRRRPARSSWPRRRRSSRSRAIA